MIFTDNIGIKVSDPTLQEAIIFNEIFASFTLFASSSYGTGTKSNSMRVAVLEKLIQSSLTILSFDTGKNYIEFDFQNHVVEDNSSTFGIVDAIKGDVTLKNFNILHTIDKINNVFAFISLNTTTGNRYLENFFIDGNNKETSALSIFNTSANIDIKSFTSTNCSCIINDGGILISSFTGNLTIDGASILNAKIGINSSGVTNASQVQIKNSYIDGSSAAISPNKFIDKGGNAVSDNTEIFPIENRNKTPGECFKDLRNAIPKLTGPLFGIGVETDRREYANKYRILNPPYTYSGSKGRYLNLQQKIFDMKIPTDIEAKGDITIGTSETEIEFNNVPRIIRIQADKDNTDTIYLGESGVLADGTNSFAKLEPQDEIIIDYNDHINEIFAISGTASQKINAGAILEP